MKHDFYLNMLGLKVENFDPNPKHSSSDNKKDINDCTFRSLCKLFDKDWDTIFKEMTDLAFIEKRMWNSIHLLEVYLKDLGFDRYNFGYREMTIGEFMYKHKTGKYLISTPGHIVCYIDGAWFDRLSDRYKPDIFLTEFVNCVFTDVDLTGERSEEKRGGKCNE